MTDLEAHARRIGELMRQFESHPDDETRDRVFELLEHVDHLHRTCVWKTFELLTELGGKGLVDRLTSHEAVKTLFVLYDLIPSTPLRPVEQSATVTPPFSGGFVPLAVEGRDVAPGRAWRAAFAADDLPPGSIDAVEVDGVPVLLVRVAGGEAFAYRNGCRGSSLPLHLVPPRDDRIHCPWHGCVFDARTGARLDGEGPGLEPFEVEVRDGLIHVAARAGS